LWRLSATSGALAEEAAPEGERPLQQRLRPIVLAEVLVGAPDDVQHLRLGRRLMGQLLGPGGAALEHLAGRDRAALPTFARIAASKSRMRNDATCSARSASRPACASAALTSRSFTVIVAAYPPRRRTNRAATATPQPWRAANRPTR
jgi:hypothetical protein